VLRARSFFKAVKIIFGNLFAKTCETFLSLALNLSDTHFVNFPDNVYQVAEFGRFVDGKRLLALVGSGSRKTGGHQNYCSDHETFI
jgi:hypothetical protein